MEVITNMNKKLLTLLILPLFTLSGCVTSTGKLTRSNEDRLYTIPPYTPPTPPEQPKNIESIDILGIPEDHKIGMGLFNELNIRCQITYTDSTTNTFQLYEETLPYEIREMLGIEGEHTITLQIRNQTISFNVIMVDEGIRYLVRFLNYNDDVLSTVKVMPNNKVSYNGDEPYRMSDISYKYKHNGWDHDLDTYLVDQNTDIYATYDATLKINDYLPIEQTAQLVKEYKGIIPNTSNEGSYAMYYAGRITNFPISTFKVDYINHTEGQKEQIDYSFDESDSPLNPDISSPAYQYHPDIAQTIPAVINKSYNYVDEEKDAINPDYVPAGAYIINATTVDSIPFVFGSVRSRNIEGKTYNTAVNDYRNVVESYFSNARFGRLYIPEDYPTGKYNACVFADIDVYTYVYAENRPTGLSNSPIFAIACISDIYVGLNKYENRIISSPVTAVTTTRDDEMMRVGMFGVMMEQARKAYEG